MNSKRFEHSENDAVWNRGPNKLPALFRATTGRATRPRCITGVEEELQVGSSGFIVFEYYITLAINTVEIQLRKRVISNEFLPPAKS